MNRTKRPISQRLQKKMAKTIRSAQGRYLVPETRQYSDTLTTKEMLKKYPKKEAAKKEEMLISAIKGMAIKKKGQHKNISRRTTPGPVSGRESAPAHVHSEGKRWMKTLMKQSQTQRAIQSHKGLSGRKR